MVRLQTLILLLIAGGMVSACGVVPRGAQRPVRTVSAVDTSSSSSSPTASSTKSPDSDSPVLPPAMKVSSLNEAKATLMQAYRDWKGTPYVLGGASQKGVDCSMLVNIVFNDYFGIDLPANTKTQLNVGDGIRRVAVRTGDLVFFKTGRKSLHVGIAVNQGEFMHASTSKGVMISKLGNRYWRNRFLAARRVL